MHGLLIIDKPEGMTSHDVVARVRRILGTRRVGHTGTLDPFATGVMVVLVGNATRLARFLDKDLKEYVALVQFGWETDTGDLTGSRTADSGLRKEEIATKLQTIDWNAVFGKFRGEIMQTPPMYSAKKVEGRKLYELARKGVEIAREAVPVSIVELELDTVEQGLNTGADSSPADGAVLSEEGKTEIPIRVVCSAGTYIRTLAEEIGREAGLGAHLTKLRRTAAGKFRLEQALTLDELEALPVPAGALLPVELAVAHLPELALSEDRIGPTRNGLPSRAADGKYNSHEFVRMTGSEGKVVAVGVYDDSEKVIRPKVVLI